MPKYKVHLIPGLGDPQEPLEVEAEAWDYWPGHSLYVFGKSLKGNLPQVFLAVPQTNLMYFIQEQNAS